ncbi:MAG: DUF2399 domain-containing protein [Victivallales bacterium]|nr:DUF2399 domain-containing protein [Victivallales bacterium]
MNKDKYFEQIAAFIRDDNEFSALISRICRYYNTNGKVQNKLTISKPSEVLTKKLQFAFNSDCFKNTYIDLKLFFESFSKLQKEEWLQKIFELSGITKKPKSLAEAEKKESQKILLKKLQLNFPFLDSNLLFFLKEKGFLKKYKKDLILDSLKVFEYILSNKNILDFSELGSKVLNDSKAVREGTEIFNIVYKLLLKILENRGIKEKWNTQFSVFEYFKIITNPTAVKVTLYGPFTFLKKQQKYCFIKRLWEVGESVTLSMDNLQGIESFRLDENFELFTCENESPFNALKRNSSNKGLIFTSGYPNSAVKKVLELLKEKRKYVFHWGDSDFDGYYIASIIDSFIPVKLWRCNIEDLKKRHEKLIEIEDPEKISRIERFLEKNPKFPFRNELRFTLQNGWLEQENW